MSYTCYTFLLLHLWDYKPIIIEDIYVNKPLSVCLFMKTLLNPQSSLTNLLLPLWPRLLLLFLLFLLLSCAGLQTDGIYRVSGNLAVIQKLRFMVNHGENTAGGAAWVLLIPMWLMLESIHSTNPAQSKGLDYQINRHDMVHSFDESLDSEMDVLYSILMYLFIYWCIYSSLFISSIVLLILRM